MKKTVAHSTTLTTTQHNIDKQIEKMERIENICATIGVVVFGPIILLLYIIVGVPVLCLCLAYIAFIIMILGIFWLFVCEEGLGIKNR